MFVNIEYAAVGSCATGLYCTKRLAATQKTHKKNFFNKTQLLKYGGLVQTCVPSALIFKGSGF